MSGLSDDDDVVVDRPTFLYASGAQAYLESGLAAASEGRLEHAVVQFERCLDLDPDEPRALYHLATVESELGRPRVALSAALTLLESEWEDADLWQLIAELRWATGDIDGALESANSALALDESHSARGLVGLVLERMPGRGAEATVALAAAHLVCPAEWPLPLPVADDEWQLLLDDALARVRDAVRTFWSPVPVLWEDWPTPSEVAAPRFAIAPETRLVGAHEDSEPLAPVALRLFRRNLVRAADRAALVDNLAKALEVEANAWIAPPEP